VKKRKLFSYQRAAQQIIGREGETATLFLRCFVSLTLRVFGFAPRQLNRWASSCSPEMALIDER